MKFQNIFISAAFTLLLYLIYISRYIFDELSFSVLLFGLLIVAGLFVWREVLSREQITQDERTELLAGKAARYTLVGAFAVIILIMAFLTVTDRPTSPIGVLAMLVGLLSILYALTYEYLKKKH
jgi:nicotinamide riboside transporter PnuC